jgi:hypothetical protein
MDWVLEVVVEESPDELELRKKVEESLKDASIFEYMKRLEEELKEMPSFKLRRKIENDLGHITIFDNEPGLLRFKLKYLPMILRTSMDCVDIGKVKSLEDMLRFLKNVEEESYSVYKRCLRNRETHNLLEKWIQEDADSMDWLVAKLSIKPRLVERIMTKKGGGVKHLAWPVCVLELEEVRREVDFLLNEPFLTMDNEYDKWIVGKIYTYASIENEKSKAEDINAIAKGIGKIFNKISEAGKKYGNFWFTFFFFD